MEPTPHLRRSVAATAGLALAAGLSTSIATPATSTASTPAVASTGQPDRAAGRCPKHVKPMSSVGVLRAGTRALKDTPELYPGLDTRRAKVQSAARTWYSDARGRQVRRMCGKHVARRTVVVYLAFPKMRPSASLSQGVVFVSRFPHGYRVWHVAH
jgi:hypothetical protein